MQKLPVGEPVNLSACAANEVTERARVLDADLILVATTTDTACGITTVRALSAEIPNACIVMIGNNGDESSIYEAIRAGANGYIADEISTDILARVLKGVMRGELGLSRADALRVVRRFRHVASEPILPIPTSLRDKLTPRELEVFELVRQGWRSREISERLTIAQSTVYKHIQNILDKLQVHSRAQAIFTVDPRRELAPLASHLRSH
jgi:DNA-binding NarL/FixJ family response regulator